MMKENEIKWITGLKGMCAVSVVLLHMLACFYSDAITGSSTISRLNTYNFISLTPINIVFNGSFAVYIFGLISVYLLAYSWYTRYMGYAKKDVKQIFSFDFTDMCMYVGRVCYD